MVVDAGKEIDAFLSGRNTNQQETDERLSENQARAKVYVDGNVMPAFEELRTAFEERGFGVEIARDSDKEASLNVTGQGISMKYVAGTIVNPGSVLARKRVEAGGRASGQGSIVGSGSTSEVESISRESIKADFLKDWKNVMSDQRR